MKAKLTLVLAAFAISSVAAFMSSTSHPGGSLQGRGGSVDCASCHYGITLSDTTTGAEWPELLFQDEPGLTYKTGENLVRFEIALASGNTADGWIADTMYDAFRFAINIRDTTGGPAGYITRCDCEQGGEFRESGSFVEATEVIPMRHFETSRPHIAPYTGNGSFCSFYFTPLRGYTGPAIATFRALAFDSSGFPVDVMAYATDTIEYSPSMSVSDPKMSTPVDAGLFTLDGRQGGRLYVQDRKLKIKINQ